MFLVAVGVYVYIPNNSKFTADLPHTKKKRNIIIWNACKLLYFSRQKNQKYQTN